MCGRFAQGFAVRVIAEQLERGELGIDDIRDLDDHYPSFNVAPTTYQAVYRRERSNHQDHTAGPMESADVSRETGPVATDTADTSSSTTAQVDNAPSAAPKRHILQGMKWGLIPFWTKRAPDSMSQLKTINCRDDSLIENRGMWNSMKGRKRCVVPVQGYYEWLKKGPKEKVPHFTKRKDGGMLLLAGLYDCVQYEGSSERIWTFTIITTAATQGLSWLHDRMPLIFDPGTEQINRWLDDDSWSSDLVRLLKPYEGELECYPVKKEIGKVGNNSPDFIIPIDSKENKSNIANFFQKQSPSTTVRAEKVDESPAKDEEENDDVDVLMAESESRAVENGQSENNAPMPEVAKGGTTHSGENNITVKEEQEEEEEEVKSVLHEEDLPFRFIPSHLETRPLETMDVFTASIEPRMTGKVIKFINSVLKRGDEDVAHLKRIRSRAASNSLDEANTGNRETKRVKLEGGHGTATTAPPAAAPDRRMDILLCPCAGRTEEDLYALLAQHDLAHLSLERTPVSRFPPLTAQQLSAWRALWPLNWRVPESRRVRMPRSEFDACERVMTSTLDAAALMARVGDVLPITAVAWDPVTGQEVARSSDGRHGAASPSPSSSSPPSGQQQQQKRQHHHPLRHAVMDLVAAVAAFEVMRRIDHPDETPRYLCSQLYVFLTHEPCVMCCMALLHARVQKVFYARPMRLTGGMESGYGIHWRKELNHRFCVFGGWMPERAGHVDENTMTGLVEEVGEGEGDSSVVPLTTRDEVPDLEAELYGNHPPRTCTDVASDDTIHDDDHDDGLKEGDETDEALAMIEPESGNGPFAMTMPPPDSKGGSSPSKAGSAAGMGTLPVARSRPRLPRQKLVKKTPKMTDFFGKKANQ